MKNLKNTFILLIICIITVIILFQVYVAYARGHTDTNSYLQLIEGKGTLNQTFLELQKRYELHAGDAVRIIGESGLGVIEWGDGSITRLGGNTKVEIRQDDVSSDRTSIQIDFELIAGKTWSNVVSFIGEDSSFTEQFQGVEAGVRGTIFDVDLEKEYINVIDHAVTLISDNGEEIIIDENTPFNISDFTPIDLNEFLSQVRDIDWVEINTRFDEQFLKELQSELTSSMQEVNPFVLFMEKFLPQYRVLYELDTTGDYATVEALIERMSDKKKAKAYPRVLSEYQNMNFIGPENESLYTRKLYYKQALLELAPTKQEQENLLIANAYDLQDMLQSGNLNEIIPTLEIFVPYKDIIQNTHIPDLVSSTFGELGAEGIENLKSHIGELQNIFSIDIEAIQNLSPETLKKGVDALDTKIQETLDARFGETLDGVLQTISQ